MIQQGENAAKPFSLTKKGVVRHESTADRQQRIQQTEFLNLLLGVVASIQKNKIYLAQAFVSGALAQSQQEGMFHLSDLKRSCTRRH